MTKPNNELEDPLEIGDYEKAQTFLQDGSVVTERCVEYACVQGYRFLQLVLERGDKETIVISDFLNVPCKSGACDIFDLIVLHGAFPDVSHLCEACEFGHTDIVDRILKFEIDISEYESPLVSCCVLYREGGINIFYKVFLYGCNVNYKGYCGSTAIITAIFHQHTELVKILLDLGADLNIREQFGRKFIR